MKVPTIHVTWEEFHALTSGSSTASRRMQRIVLLEFAHRNLHPTDFALVEPCRVIQLQPHLEAPAADARLTWEDREPAYTASEAG